LAFAFPTPACARSCSPLISPTRTG
jgi:hypothetical protein